MFLRPCIDLTFLYSNINHMLESPPASSASYKPVTLVSGMQHSLEIPVELNAIEVGIVLYDIPQVGNRMSKMSSKPKFRLFNG